MDRKKTNVLFVGHFGAKNIGDELLLRAEIDLLDQTFPTGIKPFVYSYNVSTAYYDKSPYRIKQIQGFSFRSFFNSIYQIIKCVKNIDLIIVGGGGIIQDKYFVYRPLSTLIPAIIGFIYNKPIYGFSLGIYKINLTINKRIFKSFIKYARFITYRDKTSEDNIKKIEDINVSKNSFLIPDSALAINIHNFDISLNTTNVNPYFVITIREVFSEVINDLVELIQEQSIKYQVKELKLIAFEDVPSEYEVLSKLSKRLSEKFTIEIISFPNLNNYLSLLKNSTLIIAGRLHGCIPSYVLGKNLIGLAYEEKVSDFCSTHGIPFAHIENLKEIKLSNKESYKPLADEIEELKKYASCIKETYQNKVKIKLIEKLILITLLIRVFSINLIIHVFNLDYKK